MQTGDLVMIREGETIILELAPEPPVHDGDPFTRYSSSQTLQPGDEFRCIKQEPGVAVKFTNAVIATHPSTGQLHVFIAGDIEVETGEG